jgi:hypothetical protein
MFIAILGAGGIAPFSSHPSIDRTRNGAVDEERTGSAARRVYRAKSAGNTVNTAKRGEL